jgi:hypothetical protein
VAAEQAALHRPGASSSRISVMDRPADLRPHPRSDRRGEHGHDTPPAPGRGDGLVAVPAGVVTVMGLVLAPACTVALI